MRISNSWLTEMVETPPSTELGHIFEMAGIGVENYDEESGVWTLEVTSNRGDWLSAIGLAREVAAMTAQRFRAPIVAELEELPLTGVEVEIEDPQDCSRYCALLIEGVKVGDSPQWLQDRLTECGMRPVNNIVDVTNYVMLERGQPLHAFDADKVKGSKIIVRRARSGEKITTLDEAERELSEEVLVIADTQDPIAVAGLMGGADSEVTESTTRILLESAHFTPGRVRRAMRLLGLNSEASRRFARWVDPSGIVVAATRAAHLITELAGGKLAPGLNDRYPAPTSQRHVALRASRCASVLGLAVDEETIKALLERLGIKYLATTEGKLQFSMPSWRRDIEAEIDLIEEVARINGYEHIPVTLPKTVNAFAGRNLSQRLEDAARELLVRCGMQEITTYSLENSADVARAGLDTAAPVVRLRNPLSDDYTQLRTSIFPSLLHVLQCNAASDSGARLRLFELAKIYCPAAQEIKQPDERRIIGLALLAAPSPSHWQKESAAPIDFFTLKGILQDILQGLGTPPAHFQEASVMPFHPGRCATLSIDGENIGCLGEVHPAVAERYDLRHRAYLAQIDFELLVRHIALVPQYQAVSKLPPADRDIALVVPEKITAGQLETAVRRAGGPLLESARLFDVYQGSSIQEGFKSVAIALRFRSAERTLQDTEIEAAMRSIRETAEKSLGAQLRA